MTALKYSITSSTPTTTPSNAGPAGNTQSPPRVAMGSDSTTLPRHLEKVRTRVTVGFKKPINPTGIYAAHTYQALGVDNSLDLPTFQTRCVIQITHKIPEQIVFEVAEIDAPLANAFRRILLAEIPTIAIENVFVHTNSSIMHDEQLAHRLGLIPLLVDPRPFQTWTNGDSVTPQNAVKFRLQASCDYAKTAPRDMDAPADVLYVGHKVLSSAIQYVPTPGQDELLHGAIPRPVHDDILLCKLRPGQSIHVETDATKNIAKEHAKWSPVSTASYRMLPEVSITQQPDKEVAARLKKLCPADVFDIEDDGILAARPRDCTMCRECIREGHFSNHVELTRKRDHFIFDVESTGALPASTLVTEALDILIGKCNKVLKGLDAALERRGELGKPDDDDDNE